MNILAAELEGEKPEACTEDLWTKFKTSLLEAIQNFIQHKTACMKEISSWVSPALHKFIERRDRVFKKTRKQGTEELKTETCQLRREVQRQTVGHMGPT